MSNYTEMVGQIVAAHTAKTPLSKQQVLEEIKEIHDVLMRLDKGEEGYAPEPHISKGRAFRKNHVTCMICGKEMKSLGRHIRSAHGMTPKEYRLQFDIPRTQPLTARSYSERRQQLARERDLGENLAKAREARRERRNGS